MVQTYSRNAAVLQTDTTEIQIDHEYHDSAHPFPFPDADTSVSIIFFSLALTEKREVGEGACVAARVRAAQRRHGLPGPYLRWHRRSLVVRGRGRGRGRRPPGARAAHAALRRVRRKDQEARRLPALQARVPAPPAPRLRLRPRRRRRRRRGLQSCLVQVNAMQMNHHMSMSCKKMFLFHFFLVCMWTSCRGSW